MKMKMKMKIEMKMTLHDAFINFVPAEDDLL